MKTKWMLWVALAALMLASLACSFNLGSAPVVEPVEGQPPVIAAPSNDGQPASAASGDLQYASAGQVQISLGESRITEDGVFIYTIGSVTNNTNRPISAHILIEYLDVAGNPIDVSVFGDTGQYDATNAYAPIAPGQTGYFDRIRDVSKLSVKPVSARVLFDYAVMEKTSPLGVFTNTQWNVADEMLTYSGTLANNGDAACQSATAVAVLVRGGKPVAISSVMLEGDELAPGASKEFTYEQITDFLPMFDSVNFVMDCSPLSFER